MDNEWISLASFFLHGYYWRNDGMIYDKKKIINGLMMVKKIINGLTMG